MDKTTKIKEAIETGLAFALVFGLAMPFGWMNPYWAGWAVAVIALAAPSGREKSQLCLQRYMQHFPARGEVVIVDRRRDTRAKAGGQASASTVRKRRPSMARGNSTISS